MHETTVDDVRRYVLNGASCYSGLKLLLTLISAMILANLGLVGAMGRG